MAVHIFDIDHTLIKQSTARCFIRQALKRKIISLRQLFSFPRKWLLYRYALIDPQFIEKEIRVIEGLSENLLREVSGEAFHHCGRALLFREGEALIRTLKEKGERVIFATSSFELLIQPLLAHFGVFEAVATRLEFLNGQATGRTLGSAAFGENKRRAVEAWLEENRLNPEEAIFYSDSYNDLPLLEACGKAVAVNPDSRLRREARNRGWTILRFSETLG